METERTIFYYIGSVVALLIGLSTLNKDRLTNKKIRLEIDALQRKAKNKRKK